MAQRISRIDYPAKSACLLTKHGKETLLQPLINEALGLSLVRTNEFDTDLLGTFDGIVKRIRSPLNNARYKAKKACELNDSDVGIGSEGSFSTDNVTGLIPWTSEIIYWFDKKNQCELYGVHEGPSFHQCHQITSVKDLVNLTNDFDFEKQALMLSANTKRGYVVIKAITTAKILTDTTEQLLEESDENSCLLSYDLRAHHSFNRRANISLAMYDLLNKIMTLCPNCQGVGFSMKEKKKGLPCKLCKQETELIISEIHACQFCDHKEIIRYNDRLANPEFCSYCNP